MTDDEAKERITSLLDAAPYGLSEDGLDFALALKHRIDMDRATLALLLRGKLDARYEGPSDGGPEGDENMNLNNYMVSLRDPATEEIDWKAHSEPREESPEERRWLKTITLPPFIKPGAPPAFHREVAEVAEPTLDDILQRHAGLRGRVDLPHTLPPHRVMPAEVPLDDSECSPRPGRGPTAS